MTQILRGHQIPIDGKRVREAVVEIGSDRVVILFDDDTRLVVGTHQEVLNASVHELRSIWES